MKRETAIRHLVEMGEVATEHLERLDGSAIEWPLREIWVVGELLDGVANLDFGAVVVSLDLPAEELPWRAKHPTGESVGEQLRLGKRAMSWWYRPSAWPAWNVHHQRLMRIWSASTGLDDVAIEQLRAGEVIDVVEPNADELIAQLTMELELSRAHLRSMVETYWDNDGRRRNRREDDLWRAASAVTDLADALDELPSQTTD